MKIIFRIVAIILFVVFFGFALKNTQLAELDLIGYILRAPLVLMLLGFFIAGSIMGVLAMTPTLFRHRRELTKQKKVIAALKKETETHQSARTQPPLPDSVVNQ